MIRLILIMIPLLTIPAYGQLSAILGDDFFGRKGDLASAQITRVDSTSLTVTSNVLLVNAMNDSVFARIRMPKDHVGKCSVAILVVGIETGRDVIGMIEGYDSVIVFGIDYPFGGKLDFSGWDGLGRAFELRDAAYSTVAHLLLSIDWLSTLSVVDTTDITLAAVSFGVFTGIPAAVLDRRIDRLVVIQGGGMVYDVVAANVEHLGLRVPGWLAGWWAETIFDAFEPTAYIGRFAPRPFLLVSAERDEFFPASSVEALYKAAQHPKEWLRPSVGHVAPDQQERIMELTRIVAKRLYGTR